MPGTGPVGRGRGHPGLAVALWQVWVAGDPGWPRVSGRSRRLFFLPRVLRRSIVGLRERREPRCCPAAAFQVIFFFFFFFSHRGDLLIESGFQ